jgi:hypothetical protein
MSSPNRDFGVLETHLRNLRSSSRKILVPYITGGLTGWIDAIRSAAANGADAVEIGIPFSDPVMDGPVIQQASERALRDGATPTSIFDELRSVDVRIPADIPETDADEIRRLAVAAFHVLGCSGLARCDFFYTGDGEIVINEVNTMPGFTGTSVYPKLWQATGISYTELISALIDTALSS